MTSNTKYSTVKTVILNSVVLLISMYFVPEPNGSATAALNRVTAFKKIQCNVFVLSAFPAYPSGKVSDPKYNGKFIHVEQIQEMTVIRIRLLPLRHDGYLKRLVLFLQFILLSLIFLPRILKITGKIDIVLSLSPILFSVINGFIIAKITSSFFIYDVTDLWPEELVGSKTLFSTIMLKLGKLPARISYSLPDIIFTMSDSAVRIIVNDYRPRSPVYCLPYGVNPANFPTISREESRMKLIKDNLYPPELRDKFIILYSGLLSRAQNVENLIKIAKKLDGEKEIVILIVGDGEDRSSIEKSIANMSNVYLLDYQPRTVLTYIISSADICSVLLAPAPIFGIVFPTKFFEYMACNKPILGVCTGEVAKVIRTNEIGVAVSAERIDEAIPFVVSLMNSSDLYQKIQKNLLKSLQQFSVDTISIKLKEILEERIISKNRG